MSESRLTLRVGITGHRPNKLAGFDQDQLRGSLARVLERVEAGATRVASGRSPPVLRLVSGLAEGADRMAVDVAPAGWALDALLPMPRADYERDFLAPGEAASASVEAFRALLARADTIVELPALAPDLSRPGPRANQYAALGHALVGTIDLLVAVWDGTAAAGPGGTARVVAEATARGVPVIRVAPDGSAAETVIREAARDGTAATLDDSMLDRLLADPLRGRAGSGAA